MNKSGIQERFLKAPLYLSKAYLRMAIQIQRQCKTLEEISEEEPIVLSDSWVGGSRGWYEDYVYKTRSFSDVDSWILIEMLEKARKFRDSFFRQNVYVVKNVVAEMARFQAIIRGKVVALNGYDLLGVGKRKAFSPEHFETKSIFEELCFVYAQIHKAALSRLLAPQDAEAFGKFEKAMLVLASQTNAKIDFGSRYNRTMGRAEDLHADEQLAAAALYLSIIEGKQSAIATNDSDMGRLLYKARKYIKERYGRRSECFASLVRYPTKVYFFPNRGQEAYMIYSSDTGRLMVADCSTNSS